MFASHHDVIGGVQAVFLVVAPIAGLALVAVLLLEEVPLKGDAPSGAVATRGREVAANA